MAPKNEQQLVVDLTGKEDSLDAAASSQIQHEQKPETSSTGPLLLGGLDRRQMEAERLARLKRKRPEIGEQDEAAMNPANKTQGDNDAALRKPIPSLSSTPKGRSISPPRKKKHKVEADGRQSGASGSIVVHGIAETAQNEDLDTPRTVGMQYPQGTVKKTWAFGHDRQGDDIKIEEVLQKTTLQCALLSAFCLDLDWILPKLDLKQTRVCLVMHAQSESEKAGFRVWASGSGGRVRVCFPYISPSFSCMHSKLQLLFHDSYLRIVVPTANLVNFDWGEPVPTGNGRFGAIMENMLFLIDLPKYPQEYSKPRAELTFFGQELDRFLRHQNVPADIRDGLLRFDFSATAPYAFVHTMAGRHDGERWRHTGTPGLGRAVRELGLATDRQLEIEYVGSSLGQLDHHFVEGIYRAAQGDDGLKVCSQRTASRKSQAAKAAATATDLSWDMLERRFRIYFPAAEVVERSFGGRSGAGSLFMASKAYAAPKFPRELMRDCVSVREGMLMHNKLLLVRTVPSAYAVKDEDGEEADVPHAWAYVGSANFSKNAWGNLMREKGADGAPYISPSNWECGVVVQVPRERMEGLEAGTTIPMSVFEGVVPLPMKAPGARYGDRKPWTSS